MDKRKALPVLLVFSLALNSAFMGAWAYHYFFVRPVVRKQILREARPERRPPMAAAFAELNLTREQRRTLRAAHVVLRRGMAEPMRRAEAAQEKLLDLLAAPEADPEALKAARQEIAAEQAEVRQLVFEHLLQAREVLNREQRAELRRMLRGMRGPHPEAQRWQRGPRGESPPPPPREPNGRHGMNAPDRSGVMLYPYHILDLNGTLY